MFLCCLSDAYASRNILCTAPILSLPPLSHSTTGGQNKFHNSIKRLCMYVCIFSMYVQYVYTIVYTIPCISTNTKRCYYDKPPSLYINRLYKSMIQRAVPMQDRPEGRSKSYRLVVVTSWEENGCTYSTYSDSRCSFMRLSAPIHENKHITVCIYNIYTYIHTVHLYTQASIKKIVCTYSSS